MNLREITNLAIIFHKSLNPKLWDDNRMKPIVRFKLLKIAKHFIDFIGIDNIKLKDITISGSNAAYTYTKNSDIDLHLVIDIDSDELVELYDAKKNQYNFKHDIQIKGIDVELYVQDTKEVHHSAGIYSVLDNKWISTPSAQKVHIKDDDVRKKVYNYMFRINQALLSTDIETVKRIRKRLSSLRKTGLERAGEFSVENIAYKVLRNMGHIEKLFDHIYDLEDQQLSLEEING